MRVLKVVVTLRHRCLRRTTSLIQKKAVRARVERGHDTAIRAAREQRALSACMNASSALLFTITY
jgi:hypothetical protein